MNSRDTFNSFMTLYCFLYFYLRDNHYFVRLQQRVESSFAGRRNIACDRDICDKNCI